MSAQRPLNVLIAGAGVAGLEALLALRRMAEERVAITLISPAERFVYRASIVPALFGRGVVEEFDLGELVAGAGGALVRAAVRSVDTDNRTIDLDTGDRYPYEALVVATGAQQREAVTGATTLRGDGAAVREVIDDVDRRQGGRIAFVVPAGTSWPMPLYELALFTAARAAGRRALHRPHPRRRPAGVRDGAATGDRPRLSGRGAHPDPGRSHQQRRHPHRGVHSGAMWATRRPLRHPVRAGRRHPPPEIRRPSSSSRCSS